MFDHEKLVVYQRSLELLDRVDRVLDAMPTGRAHLRDQLDRAVTSIVLNIAEGGGEFSPLEKQRFYRMAKRSATETAAIRDVLRRRKSVAMELIDAARGPLTEVAAMLTQMTRVEP
ncbi:MAG: four helix bundle protein [Kofleriaceae bacterium]|nr:MAG: four helix bundle protein [Kofleriaceae bacterium]MBZ0236799.1 four helix bundle protein [Kofleriaceae bacterium]